MHELEGLMSNQDLQDFLHNLPGFLLTYTSEGKLIYVSENVTDHLGHSMVSQRSLNLFIGRPDALKA